MRRKGYNNNNNNSRFSLLDLRRALQSSFGIREGEKVFAVEKLIQTRNTGARGNPVCIYKKYFIRAENYAAKVQGFN